MSDKPPPIPPITNDAPPPPPAAGRGAELATGRGASLASAQVPAGDPPGPSIKKREFNASKIMVLSPGSAKAFIGI